MQTSVVDAEQFGALVEQYRTGVLKVVLGLTGILSLASSAFCAWVFRQDLINLDLRQSDPQAAFILVAGFLAGALYCFWQWYAWRGSRADLHERGMILSGGGKTRAIAWSNIAGVTPVMNQSMNHTYRIDLASGEKVYISWAFGKVVRLGEAIQRMSADVLIPLAVASWEGGANIPFGRLHIVQDGISDGYDTLPWNDVGAVTRQFSSIIITRSDSSRWAVFPRASIPNVNVFLGLAKHILAKRAG